MCESREKGYELGVKAAVLQLLFLLIRKYPSVKEVSSPDQGATENGAAVR